MTLLVFDIGGTTIKYALYTDHRLSHQHSMNTPDTWEKMKTALLTIYQLFQHQNIQGIAISSPGSVDVQKGIIFGKSAIPYLHHFKIQDELEELFHLPVSIENDANCAALAEVMHGVATKSTLSVFFIIGSGIGGAIVQDKTLLKGNSLFGGEFGYMILQDGQTFSQLASPVQVAQRFAVKMGYEASFSGRDLFDLADKGDLAAQHTLSEMYDALAIGIYNVLVTINPELVVLGGGISIRKDLEEQVNSRLRRLLEQSDATDLKYTLTTCQYHNDANLLGAVSHYQLQYGAL